MGTILDRWRQTRGRESTGARRLLHRAVNPVRRVVAALSRQRDVFISEAPSPQHALDLFEGEWSGALPAPYGDYRAGRLPLFADDRLEWALGELGGVTGRTVLELGPLEGSHTYLMERHGAGAITAVEAHPRAYLRALVVKEILGLTRARFLLGDFVQYLRTTPDVHFDVGIASGVLYHMAEPVELLALLARSCDAVYIWTHYFDEAQVIKRPNVAARFTASTPRTVHGFAHRVYPYAYEADRYRAAFCGGSERTAAWLDRPTVLAALSHFGFDTVAVGFEERDHIHGPSFALVAKRRGAREGLALRPEY